MALPVAARRADAAVPRGSPSFADEQPFVKDAKIADLEATLAAALAAHSEQLDQQRGISASLESIATRRDVEIAALRADLIAARGLAAERWRRLQALESEHAQCKRQVAALEADSERCKDLMDAKDYYEDYYDDLLSAKDEQLASLKADLAAAKDLASERWKLLQALESELAECKGRVAAMEAESRRCAELMDAKDYYQDYYEDLMAAKDVQVASLKAELGEAKDLASERWNLLQVLEAEHAQCKTQPTPEADSKCGKDFMAAKAARIMAALEDRIMALEAENWKLRGVGAGKSERVESSEELAHEKCKEKRRDVIVQTDPPVEGVASSQELEHEKCKEKRKDVIVQTDPPVEDVAPSEASRLRYLEAECAALQDLLSEQGGALASLEEDYGGCRRAVEAKEEELKGCRARICALAAQCKSSKKRAVRKDQTVDRCFSVILEKDAEITSLKVELGARDASFAPLQDLVAEKDGRIGALVAEQQRSDAQLESLYVLLDASRAKCRELLAAAAAAAAAAGAAGPGPRPEAPRRPAPLRALPAPASWYPTEAPSGRHEDREEGAKRRRQGPPASPCRSPCRAGDVHDLEVPPHCDDCKLR